MIIGTGLIARAFFPRSALIDNMCIYAAGVSNSSCRDPLEFSRDQSRLVETMASLASDMLFVYVSTCSVHDPGSKASSYVAHKIKLEQIAQQRNGDTLILRLPQVAGHTPNPHTVLNYLYARIARSERFDLWSRATRNIIDVEDAVDITLDMIVNEGKRSGFLNVANHRNTSMFELVSIFEQITDRRAIYSIVDRGADYNIETTQIANSLRRCNIAFDDTYLQQTLTKYYARHRPRSDSFP